MVDSHNALLAELEQNGQNQFIARIAGTFTKTTEQQPDLTEDPTYADIGIHCLLARDRTTPEEAADTWAIWVRNQPKLVARALDIVTEKERTITRLKERDPSSRKANELKPIAGLIIVEGLLANPDPIDDRAQEIDNLRAAETYLRKGTMNKTLMWRIEQTLACEHRREELQDRISTETKGQTRVP